MMIDGNSIVNRAFYGVPLLTNSQGTYTNAIYGFMNILFKLLEEEKPDYLAIAFDLHAPTFRHKLSEQYKSNRKGMPKELLEQMPLLKQILKAMLEGYEADDILGTLSLKAEQCGMTAVIVSGDRDLLQLASDTLKIRIPKTKGGKTEIEDYFAEDVLQKYGVSPTEFIDVKALMGDSSDNVAGVPSIGEKTAIKIIQQYHNIENAIQHADEIKPKKASENLKAYQQQAILSKTLVTIVRDIDITIDKSTLGIENMFNEQVYSIMKELEFKTFFNRFQQNKAQSITKKQISYQTITEPSQYDIIFRTLQKNRQTAYILLHENNSIKGISLYDGGEQCYFLLCQNNQNMVYLLNSAKDFFENTDYIKIAHDAKTDMVLLRQYDIELSNVVFDVSIAAYLLNSTKDSYEYDDIAKEFLNEIYPCKEEILGKGKSKISLLELPSEQLTQFACNQSEVIYTAMPILLQKLKDNNQQQLYFEIELPLIRVLADMQKYGIKVNKTALEQYGAELEKSIEILTLEIYTMAGTKFNINSPKQLGEILFSEKYMALSGGKKTKTGYSTAADVLEKLSNSHPIIPKILYYRQLSKLKSTYVDGLLSVLDEKTQKIYSTFHQTVTATGRISSTEPNLQNIPIRLDLGRQLRKVFIPTDENYCFLDGDYSQIELRVLAHISEDEHMIKAFQEGQDIHKQAASKVFKTPIEEVTKEQRRISKAINFGIIYGISPWGLSEQIGVDMQTSKAFIETFFETYPKVKQYLDDNVEFCKNNGYVTTMLRRRRMVPEINAQVYQTREFGKRVAMNTPIQGSAADIIKIAMIAVDKYIQESPYDIALTCQIHDELLIEVEENHADEVAKEIQKIMENVVNDQISLEVNYSIGKNWLEAK